MVKSPKESLNEFCESAATEKKPGMVKKLKALSGSMLSSLSEKGLQKMLRKMLKNVKHDISDLTEIFLVQQKNSRMSEETQYMRQEILCLIENDDTADTKSFIDKHASLLGKSTKDDAMIRDIFATILEYGGKEQASNMLKKILSFPQLGRKAIIREGLQELMEIQKLSQ